MNTFTSSSSPTLREVAREAKVSLATASYALRGHSTVSEATRRKVEAVAARMGYRANPQLSAFMQARRVGRSMRMDTTVALVHGGPTLPAENDSYFGRCLVGIRAVARERGYEVDAIRWNTTRDPSAAGLARILDQRGIRGLLLMPADNVSRWTLPLDWTKFFGVALDHSLVGVPVHRVTDHHTADMLTALAHLKAAGRRKPGLVLDTINNERTCEMRLGAYLARTRRDFPDAPPPLVLAGGVNYTPIVRAWLAQHRPDVVLSPNRGIAQLLSAAGQADACSFVSLANYTHSPSHAGILIDGEGVGRTAAFLLFSLLENPRTAAVLRPQTILMEGSWQERAGS